MPAPVSCLGPCWCCCFVIPSAPRWSRFERFALLASVPETVMIGHGLGNVVYGGSRVLQGDGAVLELLAQVGVAAALALAILPMRRRIGAYAAVTDALVPGDRPVDR